ncbi:MAG TPA: ATP-binding protein [Chitinophagaceae bacterium]|jgi:hypothetical protein
MAKIRLLGIPEDMIINRLKFENPWWNTGRIEEEYKKMSRRLYFNLFFKLVNETDINRAVVLMGPRRVGKTVLMYHVIDELLTELKVRENKICFISIENPLFQNIGLDELFIRSMKTVGNEDPKGYFIFFDEIQYLPEWERHLKVLVDSYPHTKFIVSGSAAAALKLKSNESGAGRFTEFMLPPLTFKEYISMTGTERLIMESSITWKGKSIPYYSTNNIHKLNELFVDYINFGGYPEVIFKDHIKQNLSRYIKSDIIDKVLLRDLPSLYGIKNVQELNRFFTMLVFNTGNELSLSALSQSSGLNKETISKYLIYLEAAFLIKLVNRIDDYGKKFERQNYSKIYLTNPSLRSALFSPLEMESNAIGHMVETAIFSQSLHRTESLPFFYARWKDGEVDMVCLRKDRLIPDWALEIKWSDKAFTDMKVLKNILLFSKNNKLKDAVVTTRTEWGLKTMEGVNINFIPCSVYAYNAGHATISYKAKSM